MSRTLTWIGIAALSCRADWLRLSGSIQSSLKLERDGIASQLAQAQADLAARQAEVTLLKSNLATLSEGGSASVAMVSNLQERLAVATAERDDAIRKLEAAIRKNGGRQAVAVAGRN